MTKDEALELALEALDGGHIDRAYGYVQEALAKPDPVLAEREACAKLCDRDDSMRWSGAAAAIRARSHS